MWGVPPINDADRPSFCGQCGADLRPPKRIPKMRREERPLRTSPAGGWERPEIRSDREFAAALEDLACEHGTTAAAVLSQMREDAEKKIREASMVLALIRRIEDLARPQ